MTAPPPLPSESLDYGEPDLRVDRPNEGMMTRRQRSLSSMSGFTLIEVMIVIVILGIIAALAVPTFRPIAADAELSAATEQIASVLHQARMRAISDRRCVRVYIESSNNPAVMVTQVSNTYDCGDDPNQDEPPSAPPQIRIRSTVGSHWVGLRRTNIGRAGVNIDWANTALPNWGNGNLGDGEAPSDLSPHWDPADSQLEIRYRPTGRIYSGDNDVTDDDGLIAAWHLGSGSKQVVLAEGHGPICVLKRGTLPSGTANSRSCP